MATIETVADVTSLEAPAVDAPAPDMGTERCVRRTRDKPVVDFGYTPGFDGVRAFGLLVVLAYHHGVDLARGGVFTVSMFFTLSGYLIATLALAEWAKSDRMSLLRFWERRARRLLPAAFVTIAGVVALWHFANVGSGPRFRRDLVGALGYMANWRFASSDADYAEIFTLQAPVQPFWSLAVEEQFYLLFPLLFVGLLAVTRGRWRMVGAAFALGAAASFVAAWLVARREHSNTGLAYYATYTRASEILAGVALAFVLVTSPVRRFLASPRGLRVAGWCGALGLVGFALLWTNVGLQDGFVFRGGTLLNAVLTSLVIVGSISTRPGRAVRLLGIWPLRSLGKISYGVYLIHWPLYLWLDEKRTGLDYWPLFGLRVAVTLVVAVVMYHLVESPFRFRLRMPRLRLVAILAVLGLATVALVKVVPVTARTDIAVLPGTLSPDPFGENVAAPTAGAPAAARVLLVGDSVTFTTWLGYAAWNRNHPDQQLQVDSAMSMGCSVGDAEVMRFFNEEVEVSEPCSVLRPRTTDAFGMYDYDAVVVTMGLKDIGELEIDGRWQHFGDEAYDEWFRGEVEEWADLLAVEGATVFWTRAPYVRITWSSDPGANDWKHFDDNDPARVDRLNEIVSEVLEGRPGFRMLDTAGWLEAEAPEGVFDQSYRSDFAHYTEKGSNALAEFVVPQVLDDVAARAAASPSVTSVP